MNEKITRDSGAKAAAISAEKPDDPQKRQQYIPEWADQWGDERFAEQLQAIRSRLGRDAPPPFAHIPLVSSLDIGLKTGTPFRVHRPTEFSYLTHEKLIQHLVAEESVFGYDTTPSAATTAVIAASEEPEDAHTTLSGAEVLARWQSNQLAFNVVDSPGTSLNIAPPVFYDRLDEHLKQQGEGWEAHMCNVYYYVVTTAPRLTRLHSDPVLGVTGSGWMFLTCGLKDWIVISKEDHAWLCKESGFSSQQIGSFSAKELVTVCDGHLWGRVYVGRFGPGDLCYIMPLWAHRVITHVNALGISGYD